MSSGDAKDAGRPYGCSHGCGICGRLRLETVKPARPAFGLPPRPVAPSSRISPPAPVDAPGNGAIAVGWLWVSTLIANADSTTASARFRPDASGNAPPGNLR